MNKKIIFSLALAMMLGLTACGGSDDAAASGAASSAPADSAASSVIEELPEAPVEEAPVEDAPAAEEETEETEEQPAEAVKPAEKPAEQKPAEQPAEKPAEPQKPAEEQKPAEQPAAPAPSAGVSVTELAAKVEGAMGEIPGMMELDAETLSFMYGMDAGLFEGFVAKMPMMNVHATELFVAQVKDGNMDAVKAGIDKRLGDLKAQWEFYLADQYELVLNAKVVTSGNYIMMCIGHEAEAAASAFTAALA